MGQAIITGGGPTGLYNVTIKKHAGKSVARLAAIAARLVILGGGGSPVLPGLIPTAQAAVTTASDAITITQTALDAVVFRFTIGTATRAEVTAATKTVLEKQAIYTQKQRDLSVLKIEREALIKEQTRLTTAMATEARTGVWCTDLTEDLAVGAEVGTMEMNSADDQIILAPGGLVSKSIGLLQHAGVSTGAAVFYNKALLPAAQKWKPTYRVGTITALDYATDKCDVGIEAQYSEEKGLPINQTGDAYTATKAAIRGWADFAALNPSFALVTNTASTNLTNTGQLQTDLARINSEVNDRYKYKLDTEQYGKLDKWNIMAEGGSGDCEDFALTKANKLLALGYAASAMKIEVGTAPNGQGHAWLVVQTDKGEFALDNNYKTVMVNGATPYTGRQRQTGTTWTAQGVKLSSVPIEYMNGLNADVFVLGDRVVLQFTGQSWNAPKVIGFETNPRAMQGSMLWWWPNGAGVDAKLASVSRTAYSIQKALTLNVPSYDSDSTWVERLKWVGWDNSTKTFIALTHRISSTGTTSLRLKAFDATGTLLSSQTLISHNIGYGMGYSQPGVHVQYETTGAYQYFLWEHAYQASVVLPGYAAAIWNNIKGLVSHSVDQSFMLSAHPAVGYKQGEDLITICGWGADSGGRTWTHAIHIPQGSPGYWPIGVPGFVKCVNAVESFTVIPDVTGRSTYVEWEDFLGNKWYRIRRPAFSVHLYGTDGTYLYYAVYEYPDSYFSGTSLEIRKANLANLATYQVIGSYSNSNYSAGLLLPLIGATLFGLAVHDSEAQTKLFDIPGAYPNYAADIRIVGGVGT